MLLGVRVIPRVLTTNAYRDWGTNPNESPIVLIVAEGGKRFRFIRTVLIRNESRGHRMAGYRKLQTESLTSGIPYSSTPVSVACSTKSGGWRECEVLWESRCSNLHSNVSLKISPYFLSSYKPYSSNIFTNVSFSYSITWMFLNCFITSDAHPHPCPRFLAVTLFFPQHGKRRWKCVFLACSKAQSKEGGIS